MSADYRIIAPVQRDGSFELAGLPIGAISLRAQRTESSQISSGPARLVPTSASGVANSELAAPTDRTLDVIVRSATGMAIDGADVTVVEGVIRADTVAAPRAQREQFAAELARAIVDAPAAELAPLIHRGDLLAHVRGVPAGPVSVCAHGLHVDTSDPEFWTKYHESEPAQPVRCVSIDAAATHAVVEVPPMNRLE